MLRAGPTTAPYTGRGRHPQPRCRDKPASLTQLALAAGQSAGLELIWQGRKGLRRSRLLAPRIRPAGSPRRQAAARAQGMGWELPVCWLLVEWPVDQAEPVKHWLSNLAADTPMVELVRLGKLRWRAEQDYRQGRVRPLVLWRPPTTSVAAGASGSRPHHIS